MKLKTVACTLLAIILVGSTASLVDAQRRRPPGVASLGEMPCKRIEGQYEVINEDIPVGLEIFRAVTKFAPAYNHTRPREILQVACRLAQPTEKPKYKTLSLAFGVSDEDYHSNGSTIRLSIYKDGQPYGYKDISKGEKLLWKIDVTNTRSLALEYECLRGKNGRSDKYCPVLYFFEDLLEK